MVTWPGSKSLIQLNYYELIAFQLFRTFRVYNLAPALYAETEHDKFASVAILVPKDATFNSLEDLHGRRVCMPEFGGIASIAFLNNLRANRLIDAKECNLGKLMGDHFSDSCIPGARDAMHDPLGTVPEKLCNLCRTTVGPASSGHDNADVLPEDRALDDAEHVEGHEQPASDPVTHEEDLTPEEVERRNMRGSCEASIINRYYGNSGALRCLDEVGEVAVLEAQYLHGEWVDRQ